MSGIRRIYLDTNIFIMTYESSDESLLRFSNLFAAADRPNDQVFVTSQLASSELLVVPYRDQDEGRIHTYEALMLSNYWLEVCPITTQTLQYAAMLRSQYASLKLPDAVHISTAIGANCSHFLTADQGIKGSYELVSSRFGMTKKAPPLTIVRPDEASVASLIESLSA